MPISTPSHRVSVTEAAQAVGVSIHSIRRWCEWHADYLSPEANPSPGQARHFTGRDIEVLRHIKNLRDTGSQTVSINETLSGLTFAEIDAPEDTTQSIVDLPDAHQETRVNALIVSTLETVQRRLDAIEQAKQAPVVGQRDYVQGLAVGFVGALLFVIVILLLASIYGR